LYIRVLLAEGYVYTKEEEKDGVKRGSK